MAKDTYFYVHHIPNFQIMIVNCGMMKCGDQCENAKLQMCEKHLKSHMFSIEIGGCDLVPRK